MLILGNKLLLVKRLFYDIMQYMEIEKKVQGRGFVALDGRVFGYNLQPDRPLRMHEDIKRDCRERGIDVDQLNYTQSNGVAMVEENIAARHIEK